MSPRGPPAPTFPVLVSQSTFYHIWFYKWLLGIRFRFSCLHVKPFANWASLLACSWTWKWRGWSCFFCVCVWGGVLLTTTCLILSSCSSKTIYGMWSFFLYGPTIQLPLPAKSISLSWNVLHIRPADRNPKCSQKWAQYWKLRVSLPDGSNQETGPFFVLILDRGFQRATEQK